MSEYAIEGMTCESCVKKINEALKKAGRLDAKVTLHPPRVKLASSSITKDELQKNYLDGRRV